MIFLKTTLTILLLTLCSQLLASETVAYCMQLFNDAKYSTAIAVCQNAAQQGDAPSQTILGEMYDSGQGLEADQKMVAKWWEAASAQSYLPAQNLLALKYYYGGDVFGPQKEWLQDYQKAYGLWRQSAFKGIATSQFMLGEMTMRGQGVKRDYSEAYAWFKISLQGGYKLATDSLIELSRLISEGQKRVGLGRIEELKVVISENEKL